MPISSPLVKAATPTALPELTGLRFVAASLVFFHDRLPIGEASSWIAWLAEGHVGVSLFFVLSGFLITYRYKQNFEEGFASPDFFPRFRRYLLKRIARIWP